MICTLNKYREYFLPCPWAQQLLQKHYHILENLACFPPALQLTSLQTRVLMCQLPTSKPALYLLKTFFTHNKVSFQLLTIYLWKPPFNSCKESGLSCTISSIVKSLNNGFRINITLWLEFVCSKNTKSMNLQTHRLTVTAKYRKFVKCMGTYVTANNYYSGVVHSYLM